MGAKDDLLASFIRSDSSGSIRRIHDLLIASGLKFRGSSNSETLLYYFLKDGEQTGVAALRKGIFSFPAPFWGSRASLLRAAMSHVESFHHVATSGFVSSSQYSAGQILINAATTPAIETIITTTIIPEAQRAGAKLQPAAIAAR